MVRSAGDKLLDVFIIVCVGIFSLFCVLPMIHIFAMSFSGNRAIMSGEVFLWPVDWSFHSYTAVFGDMSMIRPLVLTVILVCVYTAIALAMTVMAAYALSRRQFRGKHIMFGLIVATMFFNPGIIPNYLLVKELGLIDSLWSLILPVMISAFHLIIMKTSFAQIPEELEDSAWMDGCGHFRFLLTIVLPLQLPILATIGLYSAVNRWNTFQDALFYINDKNLYPLQLKLYQMIINSQVNDATAQEGFSASTPIPQGIQSASIMFATVPILLVYPWLQKYFISGMLQGAVKG